MYGSIFGLHTILLIYFSLLVQCYSDLCRLIVSLERRQCQSSNFVVLFQSYLSYSKSFALPYFKSFYQFLQNALVGILCDCIQSRYQFRDNKHLNSILFLIHEHDVCISAFMLQLWIGQVQIFNSARCFLFVPFCHLFPFLSFFTFKF